uniref:Uncharacterized protein n=1 Tax=Dasyclonium flaccidum TaxID=2007274 RepID=A0A1Z1MKF3_9FLOR|nr:hypothetical protein [Dasyclonium flaccidum]ARW66543.1 hypothetical protein [Dasyclonium flaccidum]
MIKYWPNKQGINLNNCVVDLFLSIENKLIYNLCNKTNTYLYIDILSNTSKNKLFYIILNEFRQLILDLIELNLDPEDLVSLKKHTTQTLISKVLTNFMLTINNEKKAYLINNKLKENVFTDHLLIYLIFGSSNIDKNLFLFDPMYTPYKHVQILFENFIIYISNITIYNLINNFISSEELSKVLNNKQICHKSYISYRSIIFFLNNLRWQNLLFKYIYKPKNIYNERYKILLISKNGIIGKKIYIHQVGELIKLNKLKILILFWLEIKDITIPKVEKFLVQIVKYIIYISINLFSNIIIIIIRLIIFYLNQ